MKKLAFVAAALVLAACSGDKKDEAPAAAAPAAAVAPAPAADTGAKKDTSKMAPMKADSGAMKAPAKKP